MYEGASDAELIRLASHGDRGAFSALYARHASAVYRYAWGLTRTDPDAEDATQEVFVIAWRRRGRIRIVQSSSLPWLLVTTRNVCRNLLRARREAVHLDESLLPGDITRQERIEELAWVRDELGRLGGTDQRVVHLCLVEGYGYSEAADHLGISVSAVAKRIERARVKLRLALRGES